MDPKVSEWEYLAAVPGGLENFVEDELREKCSDISIHWKGNGAIHFSSSTPALSLMHSLRSIERLFGYVTHYTLLPAKDQNDTTQLDEIKQLAPKLNWEPALRLWHNVYPDKPNPLAANENLTFRVTCERSGEHHNFNSMEAAAQLGASINDFFHWKPKMKNFDLEVFFSIKDTQVWIGISLSSQKQSARNRCELGKTTLSAAIAYLMCRIARLQPGFIVVDPMAGVGTIPIEASQQWRECYYISADIWPENNSKALINIQKFATPNCVEVIHWNAVSIPLKDNSVDCILCDLPYGKRHGSHKANNKLYPALFREMFRILKVDGEALLLTMEKGIMSRLLQQQRNKWQTIKIYNCNNGGFASSLYHLKRLSMATDFNITKSNTTII